MLAASRTALLLTGLVVMRPALPARADEGLMIDDSARNLAPAQALGMRTVLLDGRGLVAQGSPVEGVDEIITTVYDIQYVISDFQKEDKMG